ncbi:MAG: glycosyltransferase [Armatimonadetes bacterium]|nr:glycosyltransferase [Armatimonadota bacterium]
MFLGSLTQQFDFNPILEAAKKLSEVEFVICGSGTLFDSLSLAAQGLENVKLPGWVDFPKLDALMRRSTVGLMPYVPKHAFESSIPNKAIEYMSGALPILWTMDKGELADLIRLKRIGATYDPKRAQTFMESLKGMMNDPIGVKTMGLNGRKLFEERFTAERVYAEFSAHLENLARPR